MKAKITIDARWLVGGIGTYTRHLLEGLRKNGNGFDIHAITFKQHALALGQVCSRVTVSDIPIYTVHEQWAIPRAARGCDLLHVPHYNAPLLGRGPKITSIHDLIHITDPTYSTSLKSWIYAQPILRMVAQKSDHIITVSEFSKRQIVERLGVEGDKVSAIYHGVNGEFNVTDREEARNDVAETFGIKAPYVLYVGSLKPYKNVSTLLKAFAMLGARSDFPHILVIVGDNGPFKRSLMREATSLGVAANACFISDIDQHYLPKIYATADLLVMPSRMEGFGLPVLEAMACGTPVVSSSAASLPEVGGDAVLYFDPTQPDQLADLLAKVLSSGDLRTDLRERGLQRAKHFTWEQSTKRHVELYQKLLT